MAERKSILEEALLDVKKIQEALNDNTKEILRSVAKEEIDSVVKESILKENDFEEEDLDADTSAPVAEPEMAPAIDAAVGGEESNSELESPEGSEVAPSLEPELGSDAPALDIEPMDMTASSDDDVIAIYKKLSGEDEIEIVGDEIHLNISEPGEYVVKTNEKPVGGGVEAAGEVTPTDLVPVDAETEVGGTEDGGVDYEIEMGDEGGEEESPEAPAAEEPASDSEEESTEEEPLEEKIAVGTGMSVGTHRSKTTGGSIGAPENPKSKVDESASHKLVSETEEKYKNLLNESTALKAENEEFRQALKKFRSMLVETVVFNSNLTYVTKLFMEHSITKKEKESIMSRFDSEVSNLKESKKLYKTIATELSARTPIKESVENKIIKEVATGSSKQLNESTAYVDPSTKRIMDLINRVEKR